MFSTHVARKHQPQRHTSKNPMNYQVTNTTICIVYYSRLYGIFVRALTLCDDIVAISSNICKGYFSPVYILFSMKLNFVLPIITIFVLCQILLFFVFEGKQSHFLHPIVGGSSLHFIHSNRPKAIAQDSGSFVFITSLLNSTL